MTTKVVALPAVEATPEAARPAAELVEPARVAALAEELALAEPAEGPVVLAARAVVPVARAAELAASRQVRWSSLSHGSRGNTVRVPRLFRPRYSLP